MALTLEQMRTATTRDEALADILTTLQALGFNTTAWGASSVQRFMLTAFADLYRNATLVTDAISRMAFNDSATGDAMTAFADSHYDNQRVGATYAAGLVTLTGAAVGPPYVLAIGDVVVANAAGITFRNTTGGTVPASGSIPLTFQAEVAGITGNVANSTITILQTALAGVTVNNPDPGSGTWLTTVAVDIESDATLALRNTAKWGVLSPSDPLAAYAYYISTAEPNATRVEVDDANPRGLGTLDIYIAAAGAVSSAQDVTDAQTEADRIRNPTADVLAIAAPAQAQAFVATVRITSALNTAATQAAVLAALTAYVNGLPISGTVFGAAQGQFVFSEAVGAMTAVPGVVEVAMTTPAANVLITLHSVMTIASYTPTYVSV